MSEQSALNSIGLQMWSIIDQLVSKRLDELTVIKSAMVQKVNENGTVDIVFPPNTTVYHSVQNQSIYNLHVGDYVKVIKEGNNLSNIWIIGGFGLTDYRSPTSTDVEQVISSLNNVLQTILGGDQHD